MEEEKIIDDLETTQADGAALLLNLCTNGFAGNVGETAVVLGRTQEELEQVLNGSIPPDEDLVMKVRGVAVERGIAVE